MKLFLIVLLVAALAIVAYWLVVFYQKYQISKKLINNTVAYQHIGSDQRLTMLVLGDSTGVGVGAARPEDSVAGRLGEAMGATYVENRAVSGALVQDLQQQLNQASLKTYGVILIQIGGNDIIRFHDAAETAGRLAPVLKETVSRGTHVYVMSAGNVGATTNFPLPLRPFYTNLTLRYHTEFAKIASQEGALYINLYAAPNEDPFSADPGRYLAADGFHPSSEGYRLWFERLLSVLKQTNDTN